MSAPVIFGLAMLAGGAIAVGVSLLMSRRPGSSDKMGYAGLFAFGSACAAVGAVTLLGAAVLALVGAL